MKGRLIAALAIAAVTVPVLVLGLFDPLEGGIALLIGGVLIVATRLVGRVPVPRLEWISWAAAVVIGAAAIAVAVAQGPRESAEGGLLSLSPLLVTLIIGYEIAALATLVGGVQHVVRLARRVHHPPTTHLPRDARSGSVTAAPPGREP